ncbi:unnamed protein product, partial [Mesorhabditis spiculigera]
MGLFKNQTKNKKKTGVARTPKKLKRLAREKPTVAELPAEKILEITSAMEVDSPSTSQPKKPKKAPVRKEGKITRTQLLESGASVQPPEKSRSASKRKKEGKKADIKFQRPMTKKKARKMLRNQEREDRKSEREAAKMDS